MDPARNMEPVHSRRVPGHSKLALVRSRLVQVHNTVQASGNMDRSSCSS